MSDDEQKLHELWSWCKEQPGYEPERNRIKALLGAIQVALQRAELRERIGPGSRR